MAEKLIDKLFPHRQPPGGTKQVDLFEVTSGGFGAIPDELLEPVQRPANSEETPGDPGQDKPTP